MEQSSFSAISRRNADKNLLTILLAGVGGSIAFHIAAIAGVAHWWQPTAAIDEPMEITMVDVETEQPPAKPAPQPTVAPVKAPTKVEPKPEAAKPVPIVKVPATLEPKTAPAKPVPIAKVPAQVAQKPAPIVKTASALDNFIDPAKPTPRERVPTKPASKPAPKSIEPPLKVVAPEFPDELFKPAQPLAETPVTPKQKVVKSPTFTTPPPQQQKIVTEPQPGTPIGENQSGLASTSPNRQLARSTDTPAPTPEQDFGEVAPSKIKTPTPDDFTGSSNNQSGLAGQPTGGGKLGNRLAGNTPGSNTASDDNFGNVAPSKVKAPSNDDFAGSSNNQSGLANKPTGGGKLGTRLAGNTSSITTRSDGEPSGVTPGNSWRGARAEPGAGLKPNPGNTSSDDAGGKAFGLQCINRCEISGLTDLDDRDGGKDKLRIRIAIDPSGNVTSASITKSSGNSTIDRVVINGVKQMQFSPPGKVVERVVKANILL
ncbi:TonB family protein [Chamaesiphon sp. OTE_20_metabat_361]|uniref:TonB family protein n=1 Tax=Chamaesiphon sp. OTE_20_metabat_361 TaxID=2964689 RepID=UPI00286AFFA4|nr:TonB family protein [Chamaesiphon sp. OTE_20_metabat_361]